MGDKTLDDVLELCSAYSNWGVFGPDDELGTLNYVSPHDRVMAAALVTQGRVVSMSLPIGTGGPPQIGRTVGRFDPIHLMIRDGGDVLSGGMVRDFYGGRDRALRATDDILILPLQSTTQWDALAHIMFRERMYNGYSADQVSSRGAMRNDITRSIPHMVGRGVLLDVPSALGLPWLEPGFPITSTHLELCEAKQQTAVRRGDFVLVRTGQLTQLRSQGSWGDYAGGDAPGLALDAVHWIAQRRIGALATDTWGAEVQPNETPDVLQPLHIVLLVYMGLCLGEMFDLDSVADTCVELSRYEFLFTAPPLAVVGGVGSPVTPLAVF